MLIFFKVKSAIGIINWRILSALWWMSAGLLTVLPTVSFWQKIWVTETRLLYHTFHRFTKSFIQPLKISGKPSHRRPRPSPFPAQTFPAHSTSRPFPPTIFPSPPLPVSHCCWVLCTDTQTVDSLTLPCTTVPVASYSRNHDKLPKCHITQWRSSI